MNFPKSLINPAILLALCIGSAEAAQTVRFTIDIPAGWKPQQPQAPAILIALSQDTVKARKMPGYFFFENIVMAREPISGPEISEIRKGMADFIQGVQVKNYKDAKAGMREARTYNGVPGALTQVSFKNHRGTPLCNTQFSFLDGESLYTIAFTGLVIDSSESLKLADDVLSTLRKY